MDASWDCLPPLVGHRLLQKSSQKSHIVTILHLVGRMKRTVAAFTGDQSCATVLRQDIKILSRGKLWEIHYFSTFSHTHVHSLSIATVQKLLKPNENAIAKNGIYEQLFEPSSRIFGMIEATGISCVLSMERQTIKLTELR